MTRTALILLSLVLAPLGGCIGASGPVAYRADPGARTVRVPTALTATGSQASTLILGVQ